MDRVNITFPEFIESDKFSDYEYTLAYMEEIVEKISSTHSFNSYPGQILLAEHNHIITAGTGSLEQDLAPNQNLRVLKIGRGGKHTYHGPGQRVVYPVLDLNAGPWNKDIKKYLNFVHKWIIKTLDTLGIEAHLREDHVGVWVKNKNGVDAKIAAIGIRARKWIVYHGFAININTNLDYYESFIPCGIRDLGVTSLKEIGLNISLQEFDAVLKDKFYQIYANKIKER